MLQFTNLHRLLDQNQSNLITAADVDFTDAPRYRKIATLPS